MPEQHYLFNNITTILFAGALIVMFALYCHTLVKQHKRPLGELLTWQAIKHNESIFVLMMIAACIAEGISAATVLAPGLVASNPIARTSSHLFISFAGIIGSLTLFKDSAQILFPGSDPVSRFFQFLVVVFIVILAFGSPLANLYLMAGNLKQELELQLYLFGMSPFTTAENWRATLEFYGKDIHWSAWAALEPNLKVSVAISFFHFIIAGLEGARSMSTKKRREELMRTIEEKKEEGEKKQEDNKDKEKDKDKEDNKGGMRSNLATLLAFYGTYNTDEVTKFAKDAYALLDAITNQSLKGKFGTRIAELTQKVEAVKKAPDPNKERDLKLKIRSLFGGDKHSEDPQVRGFGITLKGVK